MLLSGEALLAFSLATNLFDKLVKVGTKQIDPKTVYCKTWCSSQAMHQTEIRGEEVSCWSIVHISSHSTTSIHIQSTSIFMSASTF